MEDPFELSGPAASTSLDDPFGDFSFVSQPPVTPAQPPATTSTTPPHMSKQPESDVFSELLATPGPSDSQSNNQLFDFLASESVSTPPKTETVQPSGDVFDFFSPPVVSAATAPSNSSGDIFDGLFSSTPSSTQPPVSTPSINFGDLLGDLTPVNSAPQPASSSALFDPQPAEPAPTDPSFYDFQPSGTVAAQPNNGPSASLDLFSFDSTPAQEPLATHAPAEADLFGTNPSTAPIALVTEPVTEASATEESLPTPASDQKAELVQPTEELPEATRNRAGTVYIPFPETHAAGEAAPTLVVAPTPSGPNQAAITALAYLPHRAGSLKEIDEHFHIESTDSPVLNLDDSLPSLNMVPGEGTLERAVELPAEPEPQPQRLNREATIYIPLPSAAEGGVQTRYSWSFTPSPAQESTEAQPHYRWFYDSANPGQPTVWLQYTQQQAAELETALKAGQSTHRVDDEHYVELAELVQRRVDDPSRVRAVLRSLANPDPIVPAQEPLQVVNLAKSAAAKAAEAEHELHEAAVAAAHAEAKLAKLSEKAQELEEAAAESALRAALEARKAGDTRLAHEAEQLMEEALERSDADAREVEAALRREQEAEHEAASLQLQEAAAASDAAKEEDGMFVEYLRRGGSPGSSREENNISPATPPSSLASSSTDLARGTQNPGLPDLGQLHAQLSKLNQQEQEEFVSIDLGSGGATAPIQDFERLVTESGDSRRRYFPASDCCVRSLVWV
jgi:hypothetical protein